jgi:hypothetical protein
MERGMKLLAKLTVRRLGNPEVVNVVKKGGKDRLGVVVVTKFSFQELLRETSLLLMLTSKLDEY